MAPPLPWQSSAGIAPDDEYVLVTTRLPLRRHRHIPAVLRATLRIARELRRSEGLVGYALQADLTRKTFWTMSAWQTQADMERFVRSETHRSAMTAIGRHMDDPHVETAAVAGAELPPTWGAVRRSLFDDASGVDDDRRRIGVHFDAGL